MSLTEQWRPGSFTKNFSWGPKGSGLKQLYDSIRIGFDYKLEPVPRETFRERVTRLNRPDFIPINFFLLNEIRHGVSWLAVDELVFQAISGRHSGQFDKLALYAFNLSYVGRWQGALPYQDQPALWAKSYIQDRVSKDLGWNVDRVSADDIESFVESDPRYTGKTTRKLATNLNYLYEIGKLRDFSSERLERWWLSAIFLTLDRCAPQPPDDQDPLAYANLHRVLNDAGFWSLSGTRTPAKEVSASYFVTLYLACAGRSRFDPDAMTEREAQRVPQYLSNEAPSMDPVGVLHPSNPVARNTIPHAARILAQYLAGFEVFEAEQIESFDVENYVRDRTRAALDALRAKGIRPSISGDELNELMRGE